MKSYTQGRNLAGVLTKNTSAANLSYIDETANDDYRHICALKDWPFLERNRAIATTAASQFTNLPYDCGMVREVSVIPLGSTIRYTPKQAPDRTFWDQLNLRSYTSDIPEWYFVFGGQIGLWPVPASTGNTIYITQKSRVIDLSAADYTTGTITSIASGGTAVVGLGTSWTSNMVGRYIRFTYGDAANTGDGLWYEISAVGSATTLTLARAYGGNSISAATAAYTIGQMPLLPEEFHDLPWIWASATYWQKESDPRATALFQSHGATTPVPSGRIKELINTWSLGTTDVVLDNGEDAPMINPNLLVSL